MGIELACKCDRCNKEIGLNNDITKQPDGFAILGNIHSVNIKERNAVGGGFVGNNLGGGDSPYGKLMNISYLCPDCLLSALYLDSTYKKALTR